MITPSFGLTATERVLPKLALDFTTATLDPRVTFTRSGNTATYTNSSGVITAIDANLPRFDYNPTTLACQGLLIEESRTNLLLNSLIDGTSLTTQSVTVAATAHTLSFYGTGSIDLSGTHTATVTGTGAYPSCKTYTFTPTAGTLTLTVTGTVQYAQLEAGAFATSFIPTTTTALTRNADVAYIDGTNFSNFWNTSGMGFSATYDFISLSNARYVLYSASNARWAYSNAGATTVVAYDGANVTTYGSVPTANTVYKISGSSNSGGTIGSVNGATVGTSVSNGNLTSVPVQVIFGSNGTLFLNGHIYKVFFYKQKLQTNEVQAFSKN